MKNGVFNNATLKWVAIITMLIDHIGVMLGRYDVLRMIGRVSFPIFAFLLVEGFLHTKNCKKYIIRILICAVVTEPIYDLFFNGSLFSYGANILFNFTLSLTVLYCLRRTEHDKIWKKIISYLYIVVIMYVGWKLDIDYTWRCVLIVSLTYILRYNKVLWIIAFFIVLITDVSFIGLFAVLGLVPIILYNGEKGKFPSFLGYIFYPLHLLVLLCIGGVINV